MTKYWIIHLLLILFFIANGMNGYADLVRWREPFILFGYMFLMAAVSILIGRLVFSDKAKASIFSFIILFYILFVRVFFTALKGQLIPNLHASWLLLVCIVVLVIKYYWLKKNDGVSLEKLHRFISITLTVLIVYDCGSMGYHLLNKNKLSNIEVRQLTLNPWNTANKPNVHVFLFDEYQGNKGLEQILNWSNSDVVDYLKGENFLVADAPLSTYRTTFFSIPSLFAMDELVFTDSNADLTERKTIMAEQLLRKKNTFVDYLIANGYEIHNHSMFALPRSSETGPTITATTWFDFQFLKTLPGWMISDLLHVIPSNQIQSLLGTFNARIVNYNNTVYNGALADIKTAGKTPQFIFSHLLVPHPPVLTDSLGNTRDLRMAMYEFSQNGDAFADAYISYIKYANRMIRNVIAEINAKDPKAVVIILSDHGSRNFSGETDNIFNIQWALRLPGYGAQVIENDATLINTFRIVLNNIAGQHLPMVNAKPKL